MERDKYGRLASSRNNDRPPREDRFRDPPRQNSGRQNMSAPSSGGGGGGGGGGGNDSKFGNTYGLSTQFLESLGINGPLVTRVFVANVSKKKFSLLFINISEILRFRTYRLKTISYKFLKSVN